MFKINKSQPQWNVWYWYVIPVDIYRLSGRVWSQNAINAKAKKLSYPREKIDDRQANTIPLPFVCKV